MEKFDAIIVGGGLAGLAAAYTLAQADKEVLLLERGDYAGAKNVTGGRMYVRTIREFFPDLWSKAPLERSITHEELCLLSSDRSLTVRYDDKETSEQPQSYSVLRAKFDKYFAKQAERKGASIVCKSRVDDLLRAGGKVCGVRAGGEELWAEVVIACDGVHSFLAEQAGLRSKHKAEHFAVGFKEIIEIDREVLNNRFNLADEEGAARLYMGDVTDGKFGGGFLYTNRESVSLGIVLGIEEYAEHGAIPAYELLDRFKQRPEVAALIRGGQTVEYAAHVIPEGGLSVMPKLFGNGILVAGDAAGFSMNIGLTVRGMEYAMMSGHLAAQAVIKAKERDDFSASALAVYEELLKKSFVMQDFANFREALPALDNPRLFQRYPELVCAIMHDLYDIPSGPKRNLIPTVKKHIQASELPRFGKDLWRLRKL